ncbi:MAG: polynucleotide kinase-phosphatase [Armatimonadetes bacterium]|nr:polynucleotide kinase-phosphatase [Armatimonadota bacterium]
MTTNSTLSIPELCLVVLIGPSGSGKSTFARKHFKPTEVLSSDFCRGLVSDDENNQSATKAAFEVLHSIVARRLAAGRLTVIDATNVQPEARKPLIELAREYHCLPVTFVFDMPEEVCRERNRGREDRCFGQHVLRQQRLQLRRSRRGLEREGFRYVFPFPSPEEVERVVVQRTPLWTNRKGEHGPFDIIGDVHGCYEELVALLTDLGYVTRDGEAGDTTQWGHPDGRKVIFLGDLVDRGPGIPRVLRLAMGMVESGDAFCIPGNHDVKLLRKLKGKDVRITHGLAESLAQLESEPAEWQQEVQKFLDGLVSHYVLDEGRLVVAHAGLREEMQGRSSGKVRDFALFGETTGETDEFGLPVRCNWAAEYRGPATVVYGHTPVPEPVWVNNTINIDTGCVFGGSLTALRYPEKELVSVPAAHTYYEPAKPFLPEGAQASVAEGQREYADLLDLEDVLGKRLITTRLHHSVTIREENAMAALEVMSRFAIDPKWLVYLPPTMSPCDTSREAGLLEHPAEAFAYYRHEGVPHVVCQEKHMGSRAVVIVCRDETVTRKRFGAKEDRLGVCYTRTGRRFFDDPDLEIQVLERVQTAIKDAGLWEELNTEWVCLDCELMPWSAKAQGLVKQQYAAVGAASRAALAEAASILEQTANRGVDLQGDTGESLLERYQERADLASRYVEAYRRYCWPIESIGDFKLAPFHLLATESAVHIDKDHLWHLRTAATLCTGPQGLLLATDHRVVDVTDADSQADGVRWWEEITDRGSEGMVVKPLEFVTKGRRGIVQPAVKCRGKEYLRIIYGLDYTTRENLERLRSRGLGGKRSLALREFALGIEALERFVRHEPLYRVHECVFGVLALESEPVDPTL